MVDAKADSQLFDNLRKVIQLVDSLRDLGLNQYISLPRIAVLGSQSSGKSSLLEQIVGIDFLPRGSGVVTRRPLELRLVSQKDIEPYGIFEEIKGTKFTDFKEVKRQIDVLTDKVCGSNKNIVDKPIILTVYSPSCPDLTVIDLPGITRIAMEQQGVDIEKVTKDMASRYCADPKTVIMCVTPANADISCSDGIQMARQLDVEGDRTIGVLTKIDLMDQGTNAKSMLLGNDIPMKLGYVGIKNRSQQDINENKTVKQSIESERHYFAKHPVYSTLPDGHTGTPALVSKLSKVLYKQIRTSLPGLMKEIHDQVAKNQTRLNELGTALPESDSERQQFLWRVVNQFVQTYKSKLSGTYDKNAKFKTNELPPGSRIRYILQDLYADYTSEDYLSSLFPVDDIKRAIIQYQGDSIPGFPSIDAFLALITPRLLDLKSPANDCIREVYECLEEVAVDILEHLLEKAPALKDVIQECVIKHIQEQMQNTESIVQDMLDSEREYIYTSNEQYLNSKPRVIEATGKQQNNEQVSGNPQVMELKYKLQSYIKLVVRNVRDTVPKSVGFFLVKKTINNMQLVLFQAIQSRQSFYHLMQEPVHIVQERKAIKNLIETMKEAEKLIKKDPDLTSYSKYEEEKKPAKQLQQAPSHATKDIHKVSHNNTNHNSQQSSTQNLSKQQSSTSQHSASTQQSKQNQQQQPEKPKQQKDLTDLFGVNPSTVKPNNPPPSSNNNRPINNNSNNNNMFPPQNNTNNNNNVNNNSKPQANNMFGNPPPNNSNNNRGAPSGTGPQNNNSSNGQNRPAANNNNTGTQNNNAQQQQNKPNNNYSNQPQQNSSGNLNPLDSNNKKTEKKGGFFWN